MPYRYGNCFQSIMRQIVISQCLEHPKHLKRSSNYALSDFTPTTKPMTAIFNFLWLKKYSLLWLSYVSTVNKKLHHCLPQKCAQCELLRVYALESNKRTVAVDSENILRLFGNKTSVATYCRQQTHKLRSWDILSLSTHAML